MIGEAVRLLIHPEHSSFERSALVICDLRRGWSEALDRPGGQMTRRVTMAIMNHTLSETLGDIGM